MANVVRRERCPVCSEKGLDTEGDNYAVYDDGSTFCFGCGYFTNPSVASQVKRVVSIPATVGLPASGWSSKKLKKETLERYGVCRLAAEDREGNPILKEGVVLGSSVFVFPYYDIDTKELVAYKTRDLSVASKKESVRWHEHNDRVSMFGVSVIPASAKTVVIAEGESDALSIAQSLSDVAVFAVSGAASVKQAIQRSSHVLRRFKKIVMCFDNDAAGRQYTQEALPLLPKGRTYTVSIPEKYKDINELLVDGGEAAVRAVILNAQQVRTSGLVSSNELYDKALEYINNKSKQGAGYKTGFPSIDTAMGGLCSGKVVTFVSGTGVGKSKLMEDIALNAVRLNPDINVAFFPLEMTNYQVMERMAQSITGLPIAADPLFFINSSKQQDDKIKSALKAISSRIVFPRQDKTIDLDLFVELVEEAVEVYDAKVIVLDHITALSVNSDNGLDWRSIDKTMAKLKELAVRLDVCILTVSHISRDENNEEEMPKLRHIRAGNGIAQYSDCVFGLARKRSENVMDAETIKLDRMIGKFLQFKLQYESYKLVEVGNEVSRETSRELRQQVREGHTHDVPVSDTPPESDDRVHAETQVSSRLHNGVGDISREQGVLPEGGQSESLTGNPRKPINRFETTTSFATA